MTDTMQDGYRVLASFSFPCLLGEAWTFDLILDDADGNAIPIGEYLWEGDRVEPDGTIVNFLSTRHFRVIVRTDGDDAGDDGAIRLIVTAATPGLPIDSTDRIRVALLDAPGVTKQGATA